MHASTSEVVYPAVVTAVIVTVWVTQVGIPLAREAFARLSARVDRLADPEPFEIPGPPAEQLVDSSELDAAYLDAKRVTRGADTWTADDLAEIRRLAWGDYR